MLSPTDDHASTEKKLFILLTLIFIKKNHIVSLRYSTSTMIEFDSLNYHLELKASFKTLSFYFVVDLALQTS